MTRCRKLAAEFYYKPSSITGVVQDWIDGGAADGVDEDVVELAAYLEEHFVSERVQTRLADAEALLRECRAAMTASRVLEERVRTWLGEWRKKA